jgi:hypothetical protein
VVATRLRSRLALTARRRLLTKWKRLPKLCRRVRGLRVIRPACARLCVAHRTPAGEQDQDQGRPAPHLIVSGVPIGISAASRRMS